MTDAASSRTDRSGAIMFGDRLSSEQCSRLMRQLAETKQPFICAHGRPSLVPVAIIPLGSRCSNTKDRPDWAAYKHRRLQRIQDPA